MSPLAQHILAQTKAQPEGVLLSPKVFLHLGSRAAVDQTLSRLARDGKLLRLGRGAYAAPVQGRFGARPPTFASVVQAIESASGETVVASGAAEANALGLTTQVPTREVYLTSGPSRRLTLGTRPAGPVSRTLIWLGPEQTPLALEGIKRQLPTQEWDALLKARTSLPLWMAKAVSEARLG